MVTFTTSNPQWYLTHPWEYFRDVWCDIIAFFQRGGRGYADCDTWSFDTYLQEVLVGGLRLLAKKTHSYPGIEEAKTYEDWVKLLKEMADGFQAVIDYEETGWEKDNDGKKRKEAYRKQEKSLALVSKWFDALWD